MRIAPNTRDACADWAFFVILLPVLAGNAWSDGQSVAGLVGRPLPSVAEPDWNAWEDADAKAKVKAALAWRVLLDYRPDRKFNTREDRRQAELKVDAAYEVLDADSAAACATGAELLRKSADDWERLMIANTISTAGGKDGEAFLLWSMANATSVDESFEPVFLTAQRLAENRSPVYLPAMFAVLRTRDGRIPYPLHSWVVPTHECLFYVFGTYGRDVIPFLYPMLEHRDPYVRRNAAIVLGYFMDRKALPALRKVLDANDVGSGGAAFALGQLGDRDAVGTIVELLKNPDARTRFWAAFALYEIGSNDALQALESAVEGESDRNTRQEIEAAIEHLRSPAAPIGERVAKLDKPGLRKALETAAKANGLEGDVEGIAASADTDELAALEEIRLKAMRIPSDRGNKWFRRWTQVITVVRRRLD